MNGAFAARPIRTASEPIVVVPWCWPRGLLPGCDGGYDQWSRCHLKNVSDPGE
jgi:hypothetical protein